LKSVPNIKEVWLDEDVSESEFINIVNSFYEGDCYIYAILPDWEEALRVALPNDALLQTISFPLYKVFPRAKGHLIYVNDIRREYIYEFYKCKRSTTMDYLLFSNVSVKNALDQINSKNLDIFKIFEDNGIPHITIGPDAEWLNIVTYGEEQK